MELWWCARVVHYTIGLVWTNDLLLEEEKVTEEQRKRLRTLIGWGAYMSLLRGGTLHCWRRSTPHNWWVESTRGRTLWHNERGERPDLSLFEVFKHSEHKVGCYYPGLISRYEAASPEHSIYMLRAT